MVFDSDNSRTEERRDGRRDELPRRSLRGHDDGLTPLDNTTADQREELEQYR